MRRATAVPDEATAFSHRDVEYLLHPITTWSDPADDERLIAATRAFADAMAALRNRRCIPEIHADNLFRLNQNILPSRQAGAAVSV